MGIDMLGTSLSEPCSSRAGRQAAPPRNTSGVVALVSAAQVIVHADANVAAESRKANGILVLLVKEVGGPHIERKAASDAIAAGDVEARVAGITRKPKAIEIAVGADPREIRVHA